MIDGEEKLRPLFPDPRIHPPQNIHKRGVLMFQCFREAKVHELGDFTLLFLV